MTQRVTGTANLLNTSTSRSPSLDSVLLLRLTFGLTTLLGATITFLAFCWDIQWHIFVGRDRTLTAPHLMVLSGLTLAGLAALAAVITETTWMRRNPAMAKRLTPFGGIFAAPLGAYISGYAALNSAFAFPLDQYWHTLYGIDVTLWAPFHVMIISGLALIALGAAYTLASAANLATSLRAVTQKRVASIGMIGALTISLTSFTLLVFSGIDTDYFINLGFTSFSLFPFLEGLLLASLLGATAYAVSWKWVATSVVVLALVIMGINQLWIPSAMTWLMQVEQLSYLAIHRSTPPQISVVTISWPWLSLVTAVLIDIFAQRARKHGWSKQQSSLAIAGAVFVGCIPLTIKAPTALLDMITNLNVLGMLLTIALCCLGIFVGIRLGEMIGRTMGTSER